MLCSLFRNQSYRRPIEECIPCHPYMKSPIFDFIDGCARRFLQLTCNRPSFFLHRLRRIGWELGSRSGFLSPFLAFLRCTFTHSSFLYAHTRSCLTSLWPCVVVRIIHSLVVCCLHHAFHSPPSSPWPSPPRPHP